MGVARSLEDYHVVEEFPLRLWDLLLQYFLEETFSVAGPDF
jgi:hypothetical protein